MDHCLAVLRQFPAAADEPVGQLSDQAYHRRVTAHVGQVQKLFQANAAVVTAHSPALLGSLDLPAHTYSYLALLDASVPTDAALYETVPPVVADRVAAFFAAFDARQVRYGGAAFTHLFTAVGSGKILPAAVAVPLLAGALERLDPTGTMLTSNHLVLARLAYHTGPAAAAAPALRRVLGRNIIFYPGTPALGRSRNAADADVNADADGGAGGDVDDPLCGRVLPSEYISKDTGLTLPLKSSQVLEFEYLAGLLHSAVRAWAPARAAFARVVTHPAADTGASKISVAAHRHWLLLSLLLEGRAPPVPPLTPALLRRVLLAANRPYLQVASLFPALSRLQQLVDVVAEARPVLADDGTWGLTCAVLAAFPQWQIARLRDVYTTISLPAIFTILQEGAAEENISTSPATATAAATTTPTTTATTTTTTNPGTAALPPVPSPMPTSVADVHSLVQDMIASGMVQAALRQQQPGGAASDDGAYLEFFPDDEEMPADAFAAYLAAVHARVQALGPLEKATDAHISLHEQYVRQHVLREARRNRGKDKGDGGPGQGALEQEGDDEDDVYDEDLYDEDLMTDALGGL